MYGYTLTHFYCCLLIVCELFNAKTIFVGFGPLKLDPPIPLDFSVVTTARAAIESMAATALDECVAKVDSLILEVGKAMDATDVPRMTVDPDDPWAEIWTPPPSVYKVRCPETGYLMTKPFESQNPMPGHFTGNNDYLVRLLKPVIKPKSGSGDAAAAPAGGKDGGGSAGGEQVKKEKKEKPAKVPQPPAADEDPFVKAHLQVAKVVDVGHVEGSDKLYVCQVEVSPGEIRQVITGLRKYVPEVGRCRLTPG